MAGSEILKQLLAGAAPALCQRYGVPLPPDVGPEHFGKLIDELTGTPAQSVGGNLLLKYYKVRGQVSDAEFRRLCEAVFDNPKYEVIVQRFLLAMQDVVSSTPEREVIDHG